VGDLLSASSSVDASSSSVSGGLAVSGGASVTKKLFVGGATTLGSGTAGQLLSLNQLIAFPAPYSANSGSCAGGCTVDFSAVTSSMITFSAGSSGSGMSFFFNILVSFSTSLFFNFCFFAFLHLFCSFHSHHKRCHAYQLCQGLHVLCCQ
jgi:hypothetical protein